MTETKEATTAAAERVAAAEKAAADARAAADKAAQEAAAAPKSIEEHIDILRSAVRGLVRLGAPVVGDLEEKYDISWPAKEAARIKAEVELAEAKVAHAREAEKASSDAEEGETPREKAARLYRENAEAELAALKGEATPTPATPKQSSPSTGKVAEEPYRSPSRSPKAAIAALLIGASLIFSGIPQPGHAAGNFTGLPAATGPGQASTGAPTTGGGPIGPGGCIPMDTGNVSGIVPATQCVSPSQLSGAMNGPVLSYSSAYVPASVPLAGYGNNNTPVSGTIYYSLINIPVGFVVTNISCLNGSAAATDNWIYALYNAATGAPIATTALAGVVAAGVNSFQAVIPLTAPYTAALADGRYFVALQTNGTTTRFRTITANGAGTLTGSQTGSFATIAAITPPSTFTANIGPICSVN